MRRSFFRVRIIIIFLSLALIGSLCTIYITYKNYFAYVEELNQVILEIASASLEEEITDLDIVRILQGESKYELGVLERFGYQDDMLFIIEANETRLRENIVWNLVIVNLILCISFGLFLLYRRKQSNSIQDITSYLCEINKGNYKLDLNHNSEEDLSILKNELYKITVMLKEQAERATEDKVSVKNNIVDISHQLKTPLTSMAIMLDHLIEDKEMPDKVEEEFLFDIRENVIHMEFLLQNLLKLSKFDANIILFKSEEIRAGEFLEAVRRGVARLLEEKEMSLLVKGDLQAVFYGDLKWQTEAFVNIVKNGIEHSSIGSSISILCEENYFQTQFIIEDNGTGIEKEKLSKIFHRFYRDQYSTSGSVGVGLHLAKTIIEKGHGVIQVESKEREYTRFFVKYLKSY